MKTYFYTYGEHQAVTVCLMIDGKQAARGITVKNPDDRPSEELGQYFAKRHAYMALGESRRLGEIKNHNAIKVLMASGCPFALKGEKNPVLTWQEVRMARLKDPLQFARPAGPLMIGIDFARVEHEIARSLPAHMTNSPTGRSQGKSFILDELTRNLALGRAEAFRKMYGG